MRDDDKFFTRDWVWVVTLFVSATFGLVVYAQANFISKDEKMDIKEDISEIKSELIRMNEKLDRLASRPR